MAASGMLLMSAMSMLADRDPEVRCFDGALEEGKDVSA